MAEGRPARVLVVTDKAEPSPTLVAAIGQRADGGDVRFRLVVLNPARAEVHLLHPERRDKAFEAECVLLETLPLIEIAAGDRVFGTVSVRHDPMDAIEEVIFSEPIDEIMLSLPTHRFSTWLHQDLPHRLHHYGIPVSLVSEEPAG